jgi:hypothetical protein
MVPWVKQGMKSPLFENESGHFETLLRTGLLQNRRLSGSAGKAVLVVLALGVLGAGGFYYLKSQGKELPEPLVSALAQVVPVSQAAAQPAGESLSSQAVPQASPAAESLPSADPLPAARGAATPSVPAVPAAPKVAPAGTVYLAKRITVTSDTGISSFPRGTLVVVTSKKGGRIQGSIGGAKVQLSEADTASVLQD